MNVVIRQAGTVFEVGGTPIVLKEYGCVWGADNTVYFTEKAWEDYKHRRNHVANNIDNLREDDV